ncbi:hypothetical protein B0T09DRAFT_9356 [Sordaria sp. MPI-SDFR-AT-0083]|nr:hypothetical protein B0T09DRAFT_9356 [Sordaria sp. MPI-SDFR-AT-0083]
MHGLTCLSCTSHNNAYLTMPLTVPSRLVMRGEPQDDAQRHRQLRLMQSVEVLLSRGTSNPELWANVRVTILPAPQKMRRKTKGGKIREGLGFKVWLVSA